MRRVAVLLEAIVCIAALVLPAMAKKNKLNPAAVALFKKAIAASDLKSKGSPAYRLHATVRIFDANGRHTEGMVVEFWTPEGKWREETFAPGYQLVVVSDGRHLWTKNTVDYLPYAVHEIWKALEFPSRLRWWLDPAATPLWDSGVVERILFRDQSIRFPKPKKERKSHEDCVKAEISGGYAENFCFDSATGHLRRIFAHGDYDGTSFGFTDYAAFGRKSFPTTLRVIGNDAKELLEIHIKGIEPMNEIPPGTFLPMEGSTEWPAPATCTKVVMGRVVKRVRPKYPLAAAEKRITGSVGFYGYVGTDGIVRGLVPLWSPASVLTAAALQAEKQTRLQPTVCVGRGFAQPVPVARIAYPAVLVSR